jgi:hypothetical protein
MKETPRRENNGYVVFKKKISRDQLGNRVNGGKGGNVTTKSICFLSVNTNNNLTGGSSLNSKSKSLGKEGTQ